MTKAQKKGFTLIELIVVASIISLLASVIISSLFDAKAKSRDAAKIRAIAETRTAIQLFFTDKGYYPPTDTWSNALISGSYIKEISPEILYRGITGPGTACSTGFCSNYHMGVKLEKDNPVLNSDKDSIIIFNGNTTDCANTPGTDRCYDLLP